MVCTIVGTHISVRFGFDQTVDQTAHGSCPPAFSFHFADTNGTFDVYHWRPPGWRWFLPFRLLTLPPILVTSLRVHFQILSFGNVWGSIPHFCPRKATLRDVADQVDVSCRLHFSSFNREVQNVFESHLSQIFCLVNFIQFHCALHILASQCNPPPFSSCISCTFCFELAKPERLHIMLARDRKSVV